MQKRRHNPHRSPPALRTQIKKPSLPPGNLRLLQRRRRLRLTERRLPQHVPPHVHQHVLLSLHRRQRRDVDHHLPSLELPHVHPAIRPQIRPPARQRPRHRRQRRPLRRRLLTRRSAFVRTSRRRHHFFVPRRNIRPDLRLSAGRHSGKHQRRQGQQSDMAIGSDQHGGTMATHSNSLILRLPATRKPSSLLSSPLFPGIHPGKKITRRSQLIPAGEKLVRIQSQSDLRTRTELPPSTHSSAPPPPLPSRPSTCP